MLFHYVMRKTFIACAGRVLAGWYDPRQKVSSPTVRAFIADSALLQEYESFARELLHHCDLDETLLTSLKPF